MDPNGHDEPHLGPNPSLPMPRALFKSSPEPSLSIWLWFLLVLILCFSGSVSALAYYRSASWCSSAKDKQFSVKYRLPGLMVPG